MKKKAMSLGIVISLLMIVSCLRLFPGQGTYFNFTLFNRSGLDLYSIFVSPANANTWGANVLMIDVLKNGRSVRLSFEEDAEAELWDLKARDSESNPIIWENLKLTGITAVTLRFEDGRPVADVK